MIIRYCLIALVALLPLSMTAQAEDPYSGVKVLRGTVVSAGRVDPVENIGTGLFFDANYSSVAVNFGAATKKFGSLPGTDVLDGDCEECVADGRRVNNAYAGVGFSRILQFQYGYGTEGGLLRLRSDFNFRAIVDFVTQTQTRKDRMLLADRITFTISGEAYQDKESEGFDNTTWGIGLLF
ncbi:MAG: hypothetical protein P1U64_13910 [Alcanivoracaceae bacterium]|nr:hypothetical protein [Alcanivoracaceae bacterium]